MTRVCGLCWAGVAAMTCWACATTRAADCDTNGLDDSQELAAGAKQDCDLNGIPDACDVARASFRWAEPVEHATPADARFLAPADLDGDGDVDAAITHGDLDLVSLHFNRGDGTLADGPLLSTARQPGRVIAARIDADGDADLVVHCSTSLSLQVFLELEGGRAGPVAGDLDGDGDLDLVSAEPGQATARIQMGLGDGRFDAPVSMHTNFELTGSALIGDVDGDGRPDLALTERYAILLLMQRPDGTFAPPAPLRLRERLDGIALADLEADGDLDVVTAEPSFLPRVWSFRNQGGVSFDQGDFEHVEEGPNGPITADFNGDGRSDIGVRHAGGTSRTFGFTVLLDEGNGRLDAGRRQSTNTIAVYLAAADFTGDGRADIALGRKDPEAVSIFPNVLDLAAGDCDRNDVPDACQPDCDRDGVADACEILAGDVADVDANGVPDACDPDCDRNGVPDALDIERGTSSDCDANGRPDDCDVVAELRFPDLTRLQVEWRYPTVWARGAAIGDLDGDARADIVTGNLSSRSVSVLSGAGGRGFLPPRGLPREWGGDEVALPDLDGDGDLEILAVQTYDGRTSIYWNQGGGRLLAPVELISRVELREHDHGRYLGDLDGDGDLDLVGCQSLASPTGVVLFVNDGEGAFAEQRVLLPETCRELVLGDVEGDGDVDLLLGGRPGTEAQYELGRNLGDGTLAPLEGLPMRGPIPRIGDLDGDGNADLLAHTDGYLLLSVVRQPGVFVSLTTVPAPVIRGEPLTAQDLDGDGLPELIAPSSETAKTVFHNQGRARFVPGQRLLAGRGSAVAGDLDEDGLADVVVPEGFGPHVSVLWNAGGGRLLGAQAIPGAGVVAILGADIDADADTDILAPAPGGFLVIENAGRAHLADPTHLDVPDSRGIIALGDMDRDGDLDFAASDGRLLLFEGFGDGTFDVMDIVAIRSGPEAILLGDIDGDGGLDAVVAVGDGLFTLTGLPTGGFGSPRAAPARGHAPLLADLDGDADPDLATLSRNSVLDRPVALVFDNDGGGGFKPGSEIQVDDNPSLLRAADLDGDGDVDLAVGTTFSVNILENADDGLALSSAWPGDNIRALELGDLAGDGLPDIVTTPSVEVSINDRTLGISPPVPLPVPLAGALGLAELDGDGRLDVVLQLSLEPTIAVLLNGSHAESSDRDGDSVLDQCEVPVFHRGDANADGQFDISDAVFTLGFLFVDGPMPPCLDAADSNGSVQLDISDPVHTLQFLFGDGLPPPPPGSVGRLCGAAPGRGLGCEAYAHCAEP